jgi:hypothetical protein
MCAGGYPSGPRLGPRLLRALTVLRARWPPTGYSTHTHIHSYNLLSGVHPVFHSTISCIKRARYNPQLLLLLFLLLLQLYGLYLSVEAAVCRVQERYHMT